MSSGFVDILNMWAAAWLERVSAVAWQWPLVVAVIAAPFTFLLRAAAPGLRYWVWQAVLVKLLFMPFWVWTIPVPWLPQRAVTTPSVRIRPPVQPADASSSIEAARHETPTLPAPAASTFLSPIEPTRPVIHFAAGLLAAWSLPVALQIGRLWLQRRRLDRLLRAAHPADNELSAIVRAIADTLGLKCAPRLFVIDQDGTPFVCGIWRPTLVMPSGLREALAEQQLRQVLLHELAHIRRRDLAWGWVAEIARIVWWFHPLVHWVVFRLRLERELACDQMALARTNQNAAEYAETLLRVVSRSSFPSFIERCHAHQSLRPLGDVPGQ